MSPLLYVSTSSLAFHLFIVYIILFVVSSFLTWILLAFVVPKNEVKPRRRQEEFLLVSWKSLRRLLMQMLALLVLVWTLTPSRDQSLFLLLKGTMLTWVLILWIHLSWVRVSNLLLPLYILLKAMSLSSLARVTAALRGVAIPNVFQEPLLGSEFILIFPWYRLG